MTTHEKRMTDTIARSLPVPESGYSLHWCPSTPGLAVRVTKAGARSWVMERRVNGRTTRRTLGAVTGRGAISADAARKSMIERSSDLQRGRDELAERREEARNQEKDVQLGEAVEQYVEGKRRANDGKPLKERTKADYRAMVSPGGMKSSGEPKADGELYPLAKRALSRLHGDDVRKLYADLLSKRGQRRATYAMQVFRAVCNWHGVEVPLDPMSKRVPGKLRIVLPPTSGTPNPIPNELLGAWWRAACEAGRVGNPGDPLSADYLRFILLTGGRGGESSGNDFGDGILIKHVDLRAGRIVLPDTKNRLDHVLLLSRQAREIVSQHAAGKQPGERLFPVRDPGKTLDAICKAAGVGHRSPHQVRQTFATIAEGLVSAYTLKGMMNHSVSGDVTGTSYISLGDARLRAGWQAVADYVEEISKLTECREAA